MRPYAVFDIDGTLIRWQLYHALADSLAKINLLDQKLYEQAKQARMSWKKRSGEDSFSEYEMRLIEVFDKSIIGLSEDQLNEASTQVISEYKDQVYTYTRDLIRDLKQNNYLLFAISGSPQILVSKLAEYYGFDQAIGSEYEIKDGKLTGNKQLTLGKKSELLQELIMKYGAGREQSIAVGDSEGDIQMLLQVDNPIAFNPSKKLRDAAIKNQWPIVVERKNVVYKLDPSKDGYRLQD